VSCSPFTVVVAQSINCTAFVKDTRSGTTSAPSGTVAFANVGTATGSFTGTPCNLTTVNATTSSCSVSIMPSTTGTILAQGTYSPTDNVHSGSIGTSNTVIVTARSTTASVTCSPTTVVV